MVLLVGRWAIKVPNFRYGWTLFLKGLLANMQERGWWRHWQEGRHLMCPVLFSDPLGFLVVMPRCEEIKRHLTDDEAMPFFYGVPSSETSRGYVGLSVEDKSDSFGLLDGRIVAIDYGN
jgi:hypothetical protein